MRKNPKRKTNMKNKISAVLLGTAMALAADSGALAQDKTVKIGVLTDNSGLYSDLGGAGSSLAAQMAIEDSGLAAKGWKVSVISADQQNKPDIATTIARQRIDVEKVDIFMDVLNSGVALAVNNLVKEKNAIMINTGAASSDLTNAQCSPNTIHWVYDTYMLANSTGQALVKAGGDTWFFLTADYAFGAALERDTTAVMVKAPGQVPAGLYSGLVNYFKALEAMGGNPHDGAKIVANMKETLTDDPLFGKGTIRADGRKIHPAYLFEVKKPSESKGPWDYYKLIGTTPGDQAFRPLSESACPLVKK